MFCIISIFDKNTVILNNLPKIMQKALKPSLSDSKLLHFFQRKEMSNKIKVSLLNIVQCFINICICIILKDSHIFSYTYSGALYRVAESTEEVCRLRPPRLIHEDGIVRPYDRQGSEGCDLFEV